MAMIYVLVAVDAGTLAQQVADGKLSPGSTSSPTSLGSYSSSDVYITMTTQSSTCGNNTQGQSELTVLANAGDSVRWSMQTFDGNTDFTAYLYGGNFNPASQMSQLVYLPVKATCYLPSGSDPTVAPTAVNDTTYFAQSTVLSSGGTVQYFLKFAVVNNRNGQIIGHFEWDPFIQVSGQASAAAARNRTAAQ